MKQVRLNNILRQSEQAKTRADLLQELLEKVKEVGMKDYNLAILFDSVTLDVPFHERHLIEPLLKKLEED